MTFRNTLAAEVRKTATLPATFVALAVAVLGPIAITILNAFTVRNALRTGRVDLVADTSPVETAFAAIPLGTVGAVILGVVVISSEYTVNSTNAGGGRQLTATLTATPGRLRVLAAKATVVVLLVAVVATLTIPASLLLAGQIIGSGASTPVGADGVLSRSVGAGIYWALTALIALAVTVFTRSGIVPIVVLVVNSSLVSVSLLLSYLTSLAWYLPDLAGIRLFAGHLTTFDNALAPLTGGLVMAAWAAGLLTVAGAVLVRRDA
ncbi:ABC transporter permease [Micromonospora craterilacus]|uniref:ABC transporter permease n=1 Tax=Micromonospora craterilacus TaxID=1655439 RepID=A0A2W2F6N5_9ACTN|nr:ABC transporter permease [Micromonospora craterilacus]PZG21290.1 ABC transporter permease [Micromonospora craterilacus]